MPPKKQTQLPTPSANIPAPQSTKRKRGGTQQLWTQPTHYTTLGQSLITGKATEFVVRDRPFSIHNTLAKANSPYIADLLKKFQTEIEAEPTLFSYFHNWLYNKDGTFLFKPEDHYRSASSLGYPFNPLIKLYLLAYKLRAAPFANAVLQKIMEIRQTTDQVGDVSTIAMLYKEELQGQKIHTLFVNMAASYVHEDNIIESEKLEFLRAVARRLVQMRDGSCTQPTANEYFITDIADPEPEPKPEAAEDDDEDDLVFVSSRPAKNPGPASRASTIKRERSAADVEA